MNTKLKTILAIILFAAFIGIVYIAYTTLSDKYNKDNSSLHSQSSITQTKYKAPDFTVIDNKGDQVKLSDFKGKPIVLNFWASWCPPCKAEMPHFNEVYKEYQNDVVFMMIDLVDGARETLAKGKKHIKNQGYSFPVYFDTEQSAAYSYGISSIPITLFIDSEGYIVFGYRGQIDQDTLVDSIELIQK